MHSPTENATKQPLLNQTQAAEVLAVQPRTMESWRCRGGGPPFVRVGRRVRYRLKDLQAWIEGRTYRSTTDADHRGRR
jgi:excisionase family DNA binding protein